jgi:hypothetical protein
MALELLLDDLMMRTWFGSSLAQFLAGSSLVAGPYAPSK